MRKIQHDLNKEKRLVNLLGYSLIGPNASNRWTIMDKNQNQVGFIQYKKIYGGNKKKGYSKIFGYHTYIDSLTISYNFIRENNDVDGNVINNTDYNYSFDIKRENQDIDHVIMNIGKYPSLNIYSKKYGNINFNIDYQGLYLNFKSKTDNYNIEEILVYKNMDTGHHDNKEYVYQIRYCKKSLELSDDNPKGRTSREISGTQCYYDENKLKISEKAWINGKLRTDRESNVKGTIEELASKHQMGIDCFNHFRFLVNQIIPFNEEIISLLVSNDTVQQYNLSMFFPDYENKAIKKQKIK